MVLLLLLLVVGLGGVGVGCQATTRPATIAAHPRGDIVVTENQGRLRMRSLAGPMTGQVEEAADAIIAGTDDPKVQLAALQWKIEAVPALRSALFQPSWNVAASDTLVLCMQMGDWFETGAGKDTLGPAAPHAAAVCREMEQEFIRVLASATRSGDVSDVVALARKWAAEQPIGASIAGRQSTLTRVFQADVGDDMSTGQAVGEVTTTLDDLVRKIDLYSSQVLAQARWEVQRVLVGLMAELRVRAMPLAERGLSTAEEAAALLERLAPQVEAALSVAQTTGAQLEKLAPSVERTLKVAEDMPRLIAAEREAAIAAAHEEVARTLEFIGAERLAVLDQFVQERGTVMRELNELIMQQRQQAILDVDELAGRRIDYAMNRITRLVVGVMVAAAVLGLLGLFAARRILVGRGAVH